MTEVATTARATTPTFLLTRSQKDGLLDPSLATLLAGVTSMMRSTPCYVGHLTGVLGLSSIVVWSSSIVAGCWVYASSPKVFKGEAAFG
jgi:hypothetical protein